MSDVFLKLYFFGKLVEISVDTHSYISGTTGAVQNLFVHALFSSYYGSKQLDTGSVLHEKQLIHDLIYSLPSDLSSAIRAVRDTGTGVQKTHVIINLGNGSDR